MRHRWLIGTCLLFASLLVLYNFVQQSDNVDQRPSSDHFKTISKWWLHYRYSIKPLPTSPLWSSREERAYPLAFALTIYEDVGRATRIFFLLYRSQNSFCIHFDAKLGWRVEQHFLSLIKHLNLTNVIIIPRSERIDVKYATYSVLETSLLCAKKLNSQTVGWKYFFNVNEKELPLRTNWELVVALKALNGSNAVEGIGSKGIEDRVPKIETHLNVTWIKGSYLVAISRQFVHFMLTDPVARAIDEVMRDDKYGVTVPDELFFSTLTYNPQLGTPGACLEVHPPNASSDPRSLHIARYVDWNEKDCKSGKSRHQICLLGIRDLDMLVGRPEFLANKFTSDVEPQAYDQLEQWINEKNEFEHFYRRLNDNFDPTVYANLYCSSKHL